MNVKLPETNFALKPMKSTIFSIIFVIASLSFPCLAQGNYGQYTKAECPIKISDELTSSGKFSFGYMTVPDFVLTFDGPIANLSLYDRDIVIIELRGLKHSGFSFQFAFLPSGGEASFIYTSES